MYNGILYNVLQDSSFLVKTFRQLINDLNIPIVWLFWGILFLVVIDIFHQLSGDATKYGFLVGKVMIEAFFYSLFFAIWGDFFHKRNLRNNVILFQKTKKLLNVKSYIMKPQFTIGLYFIINNILVIWYIPNTVCIGYVIFSCIVFARLSHLIVPYTMNDSHIYVQKNKHIQNQSVDAIINWEYSPAPTVQNQQSQWVLLS